MPERARQCYLQVLRMRLLFVMDPVSTVRADEDTSFALMVAAAERGHRVDHALAGDLFVRSGKVGARVRPATMDASAMPPIGLGDAEDVALSEMDVVFVRKDPPFDAPYRWLSLTLELAREETLIVNDPRGLREANEKLYALHFPDHIPETLVAAGKDRIRRFVQEVGGRAVIKPVDGHAGEGVFALTEGDPNFNAVIEAVTHEGRHVAMVQRYLPAVSEGDKRILLVDGEPIGAILRVPQGGDLRSNIHVGGRVVPAEVTAADRRIIDAVAPRLLRDGLFFVGLDVIGERLTEVNVTSPTGIQQMSAFAGRSLASDVIDALQKKTTSRP
ncbi:MAG: glutathione synthase [Myxococcales bacterium]|nr:glutathione synthase [Myxococcales bacterium]